MPSPFPGMDPYIEDQEWDDFHASINVLMKELLGPILAPRYFVRVHRREYIEHAAPMPEEHREAYLVIRECNSKEIITVIETLSPANKRAGADGQREYFRMRDQVLDSRSHLVELDLLRGGLRLPNTGGLPPGDDYAIVSRSRRRPRADVYTWGIRQPLPAIPVPLKEGDPDVSLDLQAAFTTVYDRSDYDMSIDYGAALDPPLSEADQASVQELLAAR